MMIQDYRDQMVDESNAIEAAGFEQFEQVDHDPETCDCEDKINRIVELMKYGELTVEECKEMEQLSNDLLRSMVLV